MREESQVLDRGAADYRLRISQVRVPVRAKKIVTSSRRGQGCSRGGVSPSPFHRNIERWTVDGLPPPLSFAIAGIARVVAHGCAIYGMSCKLCSYCFLLRATCTATTSRGSRCSAPRMLQR
eukprot:47373-Prymnesium_polylepis.1